MSNERITIKGTSSGLIINIGSGVWQGLLDELDELLTAKASFFKGGRVALRVGPRQLTRPQIESVGHILQQHEVTLWAVESDAPGTQEATVQLGLETELSPRPAPEVVQPGGNSILIQRTLRSGQVVQHAGHITIIGDVNPGAEVKAGGSVIVWGKLRGSVIAGNDPEYSESAIVCALQLSPMQLRIGACIARAPADDGNQDFLPEMASIQDGQIVAEAWHGQPVTG